MKNTDGVIRRCFFICLPPQPLRIVVLELVVGDFAEAEGKAFAGDEGPAAFTVARKGFAVEITRGILERKRYAALYLIRRERKGKRMGRCEAHIAIRCPGTRRAACMAIRRLITRRRAI